MSAKSNKTTNALSKTSLIVLKKLLHFTWTIWREMDYSLSSFVEALDV